jgi:hypothetical protein
MLIIYYTNKFSALHALIHAVAPDIASNSGGNLSSEEVARRLNDKLAELIGPEGLSSPTEKRNERGEVCSADIINSDD